MMCSRGIPTVWPSSTSTSTCSPSGGLGLIPQEVYQRVVAPNENVKMVLSGHYHSAQKTVSQVDTDGDGVADRNVVNMLFDLPGHGRGRQGLPAVDAREHC